MDECVSVIIPTYNKGSYILKALESVRAQSFKDFEIIVSDDGSKNNTTDLIKDKFPEVAVLKHKHCGVSCSRNIAIKEAKCKYIAFLDDDDWWDEKFLEYTVNRIKKGDVVAVFTNYYKVYENGLLESGYKNNRIPEIVDLNWMVRGSFIDPSTVVAKKDVVIKAGLFDENLSSAEDWDLWLRMLKFGNFAYIDKKLAYKRVDVHVGIPMKTAVNDCRVMDKFISSLSKEEYEIIAHNLKKGASRIYLKYATFLLHEGKRKEAREYFLKSLRLKFTPKALYRFGLSYTPPPLPKLLDGVYLRIAKNYLKSLKFKKNRNE